MNSVMPSSHRLGIISVSQDYVLDMLLSMHSELPDVICIPKFDIPYGVKVLSCHHDHWNRRFMFTVEHESFDEVAPGWELPRLNANVQFRSVRVVKPLKLFSERNGYWAEVTNPDPIIKKDLMAVAEAIRKSVESDPDIPFDQAAEDATIKDFRTVQVPSGYTHVRTQMKDGTWLHPSVFTRIEGGDYVLLTDKALQRVMTSNNPDEPIIR